MLSFFAEIAAKYGLGFLNLGLLGFVSWKLCTNHLAHIKETLDNNNEKLNKLDVKVDGLAERISKVEGKLEK